MKNRPEVPETKTVIYMGQQFTAPVWVKFIAADSGGGVFGYENKPKEYRFPATGNVIYTNESGRAAVLGAISQCPLVEVE